MDKLPEIVSFRITSLCTQNCSFCYGPKNIPELSLCELQKIFTLLASKGTKAITISGGEPLIRKDIEKIFSQIKALGLKIFLDSNADLFFDHSEAINKYVDILGLPLDSINNDNIVGHNNPEQILKVLHYYKSLSRETKRPKLKIGTVVTQQNIEQLENIALCLRNFTVDYWKIYQFIPSGVIANLNKKNLQLNEKDFLESTQKILNNYGHDLNILISPRSQRNNAYFLINPDGNIIMPRDKTEDTCEEIRIGNIFDEDIIEKWHYHVNEDKYLENASDTFSHQWNAYPMPEIYNKIWRLSKKYNCKGQAYTEKHIEWLISKSLNLAKREKIEEKIFIPLIILHDIGYSAIESDNPFKKQSRQGHMVAGKHLARKILRQVNYAPDLTEKICNYIGIHDNWAFGDHQLYARNKYLGLFNDLDFISMYSDASFNSMMKILDKNSIQLLSYLNENEKITNRPFICEASKTILRESIEKIKLKTNSYAL